MAYFALSNHSELTTTERAALSRLQEEQIGRIYAKSSRNLDAIVRDAKGQTKAARARAASLSRQVNQEIARLNDQLSEWAVQGVPIPNAYKHGVDVATADLAKAGLLDQPETFSRIHSASVAALAEDMASDLLHANGSMNLVMKRYIRKTQQVLIADSLISEAVAGGLAEGVTRKAVSDRIMGAFGDKVENGQYININGRLYEPEAYSKMVARTRMLEASNQGTLNTLMKHDIDLTRMSSHKHDTDICSDKQGKVYSISGRFPQYPLLTFSLPLHPNCRHRWLPEVALQLRLERKQEREALRAQSA